MSHHGFGIDIGGSGIKGAIVDLDAGSLIGGRFKVPTPQPATPDAVAAAVGQVVRHFEWDNPFGSTYPGVVTSGVARSAANVDRSWMGVSVERLLRESTGLAVTVVNDADAAGVAEMSVGAAKGCDGLVVIVTLGTGIGTALFHNGVLIPNCELGHLEIDGEDAETRASAGARQRDELSWERWARRLERYLRAIENYLWPDLIVIGGGVSRKADRFVPLLEVRTPMMVAALRNEAGIVGAALHRAVVSPGV